MIKWKTINRAGKKGGYADYEVSLTVNTRSREKVTPETPEYMRNSYVFFFRNRAFHVLTSLDAKRIRISEITPDKDRIYFDIVKEENDRSSIKLSTAGRGNKNVYISRFSFDDETEYQVVRDTWVGEYPLQFDKVEGLFFIEKSAKRG